MYIDDQGLKGSSQSVCGVWGPFMFFSMASIFVCFLFSWRARWRLSRGEKCHTPVLRWSQLFASGQWLLRHNGLDHEWLRYRVQIVLGSGCLLSTSMLTLRNVFYCVLGSGCLLSSFTLTLSHWVWLAWWVASRLIVAVCTFSTGHLGEF